MLPCLPEATQVVNLPTCIALQVPWYHLPVGVFAILAGFAAVLMALRENLSRREKILWIVAVSLLTVGELRMIVWSDTDAKRERDYSECQLKNNFQTIQDKNQRAFDQTMCRVNQVFGKTEDAADTATHAVNAITGGNSFGFVVPQPWGVKIPLVVWNHGDEPLTGVTITIARTQNPDWASDFFRPIFIGTIGPGNFAPVPVTCPRFLNH